MHSSKDGLPLKARTSNRRIASKDFQSIWKFKTGSENYKQMRVSLSNMQFHFRGNLPSTCLYELDRTTL